MSLIEEEFDLERADSQQTPLRLRSPSSSQQMVFGNTADKRALIVEVIEEHSIEESLAQIP